MNLFGIMLVSSCIGIIVADVLPFVKELKYRLNRKSLKPLDCNFCLSGWVALLLSILFYESFVQLLVAMTVTPFLTSLIYFLWTKIRL